MVMTMPDQSIATISRWGPSPSLSANRPIRLNRPCECGCGSRDGFDEGVGNISGSDKEGRGFTIFIFDEETYQHLLPIFGGDK